MRIIIQKQTITYKVHDAVIRGQHFTGHLVSRLTIDLDVVYVVGIYHLKILVMIILLQLIDMVTV